MFPNETKPKCTTTCYLYQRLEKTLWRLPDPKYAFCCICVFRPKPAPPPPELTQHPYRGRD